MTDRDRILANLSPDELLMWVSRGGELVTHQMRVRYRRAVASLGLTVAVTADDLAAVLAERGPRRRVKLPRPLVYRPYAAAKTGRPRKESLALAELRERKTA